jgi:hypothetical protein
MVIYWVEQPLSVTVAVTAVPLGISIIVPLVLPGSPPTTVPAGAVMVEVLVLMKLTE